ncbi:MAG TPA: DUF998 domain-containing protein [Streptosporangiaceae bacterium]|nr:DUF998 domain-containing protein [Streptosporangiaceae bacterium]
MPIRLSRWLAGQHRPAPGWVLVTAGLSPILVTVAWLVAGTLQPASYSPVRDTVSALAGLGGTDRWIMTSALFAVGGCYLATAAGLAGLRAPARILLAVAGLSSIGIAASPEPAAGTTTRHLAWTALGAATITIWPAFTGRRSPGQPLILGTRGAAVVTTVFAGLLGWLLIETQQGTLLGLAERVMTSIQTAWPFLVAVALRQAALRPGPQRAGPPPAALTAEGPGGPRSARREPAR